MAFQVMVAAECLGAGCAVGRIDGGNPRHAPFLGGLITRAFENDGHRSVVVAWPVAVCDAHEVSRVHLHMDTVPLFASEERAVAERFSAEAPETPFVNGRDLGRIMKRATPDMCAHMVDGGHASSCCPRTGIVMEVSMAPPVGKMPAHVVQRMALVDKMASSMEAIEAIFDWPGVTPPPLERHRAVGEGEGGLMPRSTREPAPVPTPTAPSERIDSVFQRYMHTGTRARKTFGGPVSRVCFLHDQAKKRAHVVACIREVLSVSLRGNAMDSVLSRGESRFGRMLEDAGIFKGLPHVPVADVLSTWVHQSSDERSFVASSDLAKFEWYADIVLAVGAVVAAYAPTPRRSAETRSRGGLLGRSSCAECTARGVSGLVSGPKGGGTPIPVWCPTKGEAKYLVVGTLMVMAQKGIREIVHAGGTSSGSNSATSHSSESLSEADPVIVAAALHANAPRLHTKRAEVARYIVPWDSSLSGAMSHYFGVEGQGSAHYSRGKRKRAQRVPQAITAALAASSCCEDTESSGEDTSVGCGVGVEDGQCVNLPSVAIAVEDAADERGRSSAAMKRNRAARAASKRRAARDAKRRVQRTRLAAKSLAPKGGLQIKHAKRGLAEVTPAQISTGAARIIPAFEAMASARMSAHAPTRRVACALTRRVESIPKWFDITSMRREEQLLPQMSLREVSAPLGEEGEAAPASRPASQPASRRADSGERPKKRRRRRK